MFYKGNDAVVLQWSIGGVLISLSQATKPVWCMASDMPVLWLPSQPQSITALWSVTNYTGRWQRHMCVNNLPRVVTWSGAARTWPCGCKSNALTTTSPHYADCHFSMLTFLHWKSLSKSNLYYDLNFLHQWTVCSVYLCHHHTTLFGGTNPSHHKSYNKPTRKFNIK